MLGVQTPTKQNTMRLILLFLVSFSASISFAQSLSGKVAMAESEEAVSYGNVDIYDGDELIASVLTDSRGNFNVALDTGVYRCVINYAGNKEVEKNIHIRSDEVSDFSMEGDPTYKKYESTESFGWGYHAPSGITKSKDAHKAPKGDSPPSPEAIKRYYEVDDVVEYAEAEYSGGDLSLRGGFDFRDKKARSGALTAGEVNDFAKWDMWQDISSDELKSYADSWKIRPQGRYSILLQSQSGLPLVDAKVELKKDRKTLYTSRTDNTGKAELWASGDGTEPAAGKYSMEIDYRGQKSKIENAKPFSESINHHIIRVECNEMNKVDIAFVVDATGSMGDELQYLKAEMNDVIFKSKQLSAKLNFRFANVFYRDVTDSYLTRTMPFSRVLSESVNFISAQNAGGGGDYEEAVEVGLDSAIHSLEWSEEARTRVIFLILDAPPHNTEVNQKKMANLMQDAAKKGIRIVPVGASGINKATEYLMRTLAIGTNGTYTFLTDHSGIGNAHIEPSTDEYKVETFNDLMVRVLKSYTYMPDCEQNIPDLELDYPDSLVIIENAVDSIETSNRTDLDSLTQAQRDSIHNTVNNGIEVKPAITWRYYPNPTNGIINIKADIDIDEIFLTDLTGKLLQSLTRMKKDRVYQMDLSIYPVGLYLLRYEHEGEWISGKVVLHP